ncbi:MAG: hypothetical protein FJ109_19140, partial [Deltaproteobacteria bacterium]|nr:hypothetical protein [Deltaproteobacteria bacterium]
MRKEIAVAASTREPSYMTKLTGTRRFVLVLPLIALSVMLAAVMSGPTACSPTPVQTDSADGGEEISTDPLFPPEEVTPECSQPPYDPSNLAAACVAVIPEGSECWEVPLDDEVALQTTCVDVCGMVGYCSNDTGEPKCKLKGSIVETEQAARTVAQTERAKSDPCTTYVCGPGATAFQTFPVCAVETDIPVALSDQTCTCVNLNPTPVPLSAKTNVAVQAHAVHITPQVSVIAIVESCQAQADVSCLANNGNLGPGQAFVGLRKGMNVNMLPTAYVGPNCSARDPRVVTVVDDPKQSLYAVTWVETCLQRDQPWDVLRFSIAQLDPAGDTVSILMSGIPIQILWKPPFKETSRIINPDVASLGEKRFGITYSVPDATAGASLVALVTCELH